MNFTPVSKEAFAVLAACSRSREYFGISVDPVGKRQFKLVWAFKMTKDQAVKLIDTVDQGRDNYVKRYTGLSRYDMRNYDLILDMDYLTEDEAVNKILTFIGR